MDATLDTAAANVFAPQCFPGVRVAGPRITGPLACKQQILSALKLDED